MVLNENLCEPFMQCEHSKLCKNKNEDICQKPGLHSMPTPIFLLILPRFPMATRVKGPTEITEMLLNEMALKSTYPLNLY